MTQILCPPVRYLLKNHHHELEFVLGDDDRSNRSMVSLRKTNESRIK